MTTITDEHAKTKKSDDNVIVEDVEEVIKKYDRTSNMRIWEGYPGLAVRCFSAFFSLYCIYVTLFSTALPEVRLNVFIAMIIILGYLNYPRTKKAQRPNHMPWYDILLMAGGALPFLYYAWNAQSIIMLSMRVTNPRYQGYIFMVGMAVIGVLCLMELCRRCVGIPILLVVGSLLAYTFANVRFGKVVYDLFYSTGGGIRSTPIEVCAKYIIVFIIFGAFLERTGISAFFINLANCIAGSSSGGPAKVAVISSSLCGMVSGSSVGNTVTTGSITIPMMKRTGYKPEFAGAVEAASSTGGQIMPPIMGAAAFLMAEYMGVPYSEVALTAILPAVLYFAGIYIAVHLEAKKLGLRGIPRSELPRFSALLPKVYLLLPLILLVGLVSANTFTMQFSAAISIGAAIAVGLFNSDDRITLRKIFEALESGGKGTVTVAVACAMAGLVAGCITSTGLASKLVTMVINLSGGYTIIALVLTMICCIVLGMGVPTTANYCIMAATCAPILMSEAIGLPKICAHFFVFYFGIVADITPPVALAAYAGSAIAKATPMKTAFNASRLAIAAFIVPYIFAYNPSMLFENVHSIFDVLLICGTSLLGIFGVASALNGYLFKPINILLRFILIAAGLSMMLPGLTSDALGFAALAAVCAYQKLSASKTPLHPPH
ncbi:MAG: TRAP transporter permease [Mailhella sp.]|nr:TRAP transporter permease [Mailhella sp.]